MFEGGVMQEFIFGPFGPLMPYERMDSRCLV